MNATQKSRSRLLKLYRRKNAALERLIESNVPQSRDVSEVGRMNIAIRMFERPAVKQVVKV